MRLRGGFEFSEMGFVAPRGYVGFAPGDGHFVLLAVPAREERDGGVRDLFCLGQRPLGLRVIDGIPATLVLCPPGDAETSHHVLLHRVNRGVLVGISSIASA